MTNSKNIAGLLGPALIAISLSELLNFHILAANASPSIIYLDGALLLVAGLSIIRAHNRWTAGWPVVVTLVGWLALLGGLVRMFAPAFAQREVQNATGAYALLIALLAAGIFLTFKAYGRDDG